MVLLYASFIVSRRWAKSMGPTDSFRRRMVATLSAALDPARRFDLSGDVGRPVEDFIREAAVVAVATDCRGRELRSEGDSFGAGTATYALSRPLLLLLLLLGVAMLLGAAFRFEVWDRLAVAVAGVEGVLDRVAGVLALEAGIPCCWREDLPLVGVCPYFSAAAGELDRVDTGLLLPWLSEILALLTMTGRREVEDRGVVGVDGVVRPVLPTALLLVVAVPRPDRVLLDLVDEDETTASLWALEWFLATLAELSGSAEAAPRYQSVGDCGSISPISE